jgi:hypothetical protein
MALRRGVIKMKEISHTPTYCPDDLPYTELAKPQIKRERQYDNDNFFFFL